MKKISKYFIQGLIALLPILLTAYIIYWLMKTAEALLGSAIKFIIPDKFYLPGMGVVAGLLMILGFGLMLNLWLFRRLFEACERQLEKCRLLNISIIPSRTLPVSLTPRKRKVSTKS